MRHKLVLAPGMFCWHRLIAPHFLLRRSVLSGAVALALMLTGVAVVAAGLAETESEPRRRWDFGDVQFSNDFPSGRLADCRKLGHGEFLAVVRPENQPINQSPWYAFKVSSKYTQSILVCLTNTYSPQRGRPWLSHDGMRWVQLAETAYLHRANSHQATARLEIGPRPVWLATQEIVGLKELGAWMDQKSRLPFVTTEVIGRSVAERELRQFVISESAKPNYVFIIGRQHPPEVTGSLGLMSFVDVLTGRTRLARQFRREFQTVVIPLVNPDGVERGHWRSNLGGVDLNRDWRLFLQPESRAVSKALLDFAHRPGARPFVFVDFHSTGTNVFYAQPDQEQVFPPNFTRAWLDAIHRRLPEFGFARDNGHNPGQFTSKAWANETFGIAAITWEFGYGTDRKLIRRASSVGAEEFMHQLLAAVSAAAPAPAAER